MTNSDVIYEVFGVNITVDTSSEYVSDGNMYACKKCQCHCRLCIGGKAPEEARVFSKVETEQALERLLAA
ncbi:MAG: hypothetical protein ABH817_00210 [archaeon]